MKWGFIISLRRYLFWTFDFLKGQPVYAHYRDIKYINANCDSPRSQSRKEAYLKKLLNHACKTVPYYQNLDPAVGLQGFPVINKSIIREHFESFQSEDFLEKHNHRVTTSGSTGNPFYIYHDSNKRDRNTADTIYFAEKSGYRLGERLFYLRLWDKQYKKPKWLAFLQNMSTEYSVDDLTESKISKLVNELSADKQPKHLLSYVSALETIYKYMDRNLMQPVNFNVKSIIGVAEGLNDYVIESTNKYFGQKIISRYSNSENGILAQQDKGNAAFEINLASYHVEILDLSSDAPVSPGATGRIVITDFFNFCMPMIRYDTGDVGRLEFVECGTSRKPLLTSIGGRKMDMFTNTQGEYVSSHIIHHVLQYPGIDQFQFIEEENNEYFIKLKITADFDKSREKELIELYKGYFGPNANVFVEYVNEIPLLLSGKRKLVINKTIEKQQAATKANSL